MIAVKDIMAGTGMDRKTLLRGGLPSSGHVPKQQAIDFLTPFVEPFGRWEASKANRTKELLRSIESGEPLVLGLNGKHLEGDHKPNPKPDPKPNPNPKPNHDPKPDPDLGDDAADAPKTDKGILINTIMHINFLSIVLLLGALAQFGHTLRFVRLTTENPFWSVVDGLAIDLMAIVLSAKTKHKEYLIGGLIVHLLMNLTLYHNTKGGITFSNAMLGVIVALANFSFAELIIMAAKDAPKRQEKIIEK